MPTPTITEPAHEVAGWRRLQLAGAGLLLPLAARLAKGGQYDLHAPIALTEQRLPAGVSGARPGACDGEDAA
jgi:hypothetical protein